MNAIKNIRNFSIIAHIDHGKSTLADRMLEFTGALSNREMVDQVLDTMDIERERGITIKAQTVKINYTAQDGNTYLLNLIDTPGHVDFSYEVSRSLAACEGALLVIDASQGLEAQTLANLYLALDNNLELIPVINKIDLPGADIEGVKQQIEDVIGLDSSTAILASAKRGVGIQEIFEAIINRIPPPNTSGDMRLKALLLDCWYDTYRGIIVLARVFDGTITTGMRIKMMSGGNSYEVTQIGILTPKFTETSSLSPGEVGVIICGIKKMTEIKIGDTITDHINPTETPLPGYKEPKSMVFSGLYPINNDQYEQLRDALDKLVLNDSSFSYDAESSIALGFGFRCGFLGLLHMEIIQERLEREFHLELIATAPTVVYKVVKNNGECLEIDNPYKLPDPQDIASIEEPYIRATIMLPDQFIGGVMKLVQEKRGVQKGMEYVGKSRVMLTYEIPFNEIVIDFYDKLKSLSKGYASLDYELIGYRVSNLVKLDLLINNEQVDALSIIIHRDKAYSFGRDLAKKMKELIPRQMFEVAIQSAIGNKVIARETVKALRKNVTAKCYGGDITRKRKLLEKQKEGKKRMKQVGKIEIPQEAFLAVLKL